MSQGVGDSTQSTFKLKGGCHLGGWDSWWDAVLSSTYFGMFRGGNKGREWEVLTSFGGEQV